MTDTNAVTTPASTETVGWFEKFKTTLGLDKIQITRNTLIDIALYFGLGFIVGFLLKRLSNYLLAIVFAFVVILVLRQFGFLSLTLNLEKIRELLGMQPAAVPIASLFDVMWTWTKEHIAYVISFVIGFLIGLKLS